MDCVKADRYQGSRLDGDRRPRKTFSAMRLATGIAQGKQFCIVDTEAGRAKHYADQFKFDHGDLTPPFSPARYAEAIATLYDDPAMTRDMGTRARLVARQYAFGDGQ